MIRGLLTDEEWSFFEPFMVSASPLGGRPARDHRRVLDAIFWIARTGAPWRDLPVELGNWNSVFRQFRRRTASGLWDVMLYALADGGGDAEPTRLSRQDAWQGKCARSACHSDGEGHIAAGSKAPSHQIGAVRFA